MSSNAPSSTRDEIARAALRLFAERGYRETSMEEIAREVGISKPAIYHYFGSKEDLFRSLLRHIQELHHRAHDELRAKHLPLPELLAENVRQMLRAVREEHDIIRIMVRVVFEPTEIEGIVDPAALHREVHAEEVALLREAPTNLRMRPSLTLDDFVHFYHGVVFSFVAQCLCSGAPVDEEEALIKIRDFILNGAFES